MPKTVLDEEDDMDQKVGYCTYECYVQKLNSPCDILLQFVSLFVHSISYFRTIGVLFGSSISIPRSCNLWRIAE